MIEKIQSRHALGPWMPAFVFLAALSTVPLQAALAEDSSNPLVQFLAGDWDCTSFEISASKPVKKENYRETMVVKDGDTLIITAHKSKDGKDSVKEMRLKVHGKSITLSLGDYKASGKRKGNVYTVKGSEGDKDYLLRFYTMNDKYVFTREIWKDDQVEEIDTSYLVRKK